MTQSFVLTLDTTAPSAVVLALANGAAYTGSQLVTANITSPDADTAMMKIWGDVDGTNDANVQPTEAASAWVAFNAALQIKLTAGDGLKTINCRVRDDVGNATGIVSDTITLDTTAPIPNITVAAAPTKISKIAGFDTSNFTFSSDSDIQQWKVKVVPNAGADQTSGTTIPVAAGSANVTGGAKSAGQGVAVSIKGTDLESASAGDGGKVVKVFVQDLAGIWSL